MDAKRLNRDAVVYKQIAIHGGEQNDSGLKLKEQKKFFEQSGGAYEHVS